MTKAEVLERLKSELPEKAEIWSVRVDATGDVKCESDAEYAERMESMAAQECGDYIPFARWSRAQLGDSVTRQWQCVQPISATNMVRFDPFAADYAEAKQLLRVEARKAARFRLQVEKEANLHLVGDAR